MMHAIDKTKQDIERTIVDYQRGDITLYDFIVIMNTYNPVDIKLYQQLKEQSQMIEYTRRVR